MCLFFFLLLFIQVTELLKGLYKQYHYSPKAWRELKALGEALEQKIWKPTNLGGTRWLPHLERALNILMKDYAVVLAHMENTIETRQVIVKQYSPVLQFASALLGGLQSHY